MPATRSGAGAAGYVVLTALVAASFTGCGDGLLRGRTSPSPDGKTYLSIVDDNGGHCGPILVDGHEWPHPIGEPGEIQPGAHTIECGSGISIQVPAGVLFEFDYWGP